MLRQRNSDSDSSTSSISNGSPTNSSPIACDSAKEEFARKVFCARRAFVTVQFGGAYIEKLILTTKQRLANGFPTIVDGKVHLEPTEFQMGRMMVYTKRDFRRTCLRCNQHFKVSRDGIQPLSAAPVCSDGEKPLHFHVHDQLALETVRDFKFAPKVNKINAHTSNELFGLDVEMVFTARGQSVGRVTLVSHTEAVLLDVLVQQTDDVFDPVTRYSGLTHERLARATWTLDQARRAVLNEINEKSVLVGHGLNSDLKALGIIHNRVIDTSVIYTNAGRRPSLRHLTEHLLGYKIQQNSSGHCSVEDAVAAVRLVIHGVNVPRFLAPEYQNLHMNI